MPDDDLFPISEYDWPYHKPSDFPSRLRITERIILTLYLWILDISIFYEYDSRIKQLSVPSKKTVIEISDANANTIWNICTAADTRYGYFYNKKSKTSVHTKLRTNFLAYIEDIPSISFSLLPALITEIMNTMAPEKVRPSSDNQGSIFIYDDLIKKTECNVTDPAYLKMLLLPPIPVYNKNTVYDITSRFKKKEAEILQNSVINPVLDEYLSSLNAKDQANARYLISMRNHNFTLSYSYFDIFLKICENQKLFNCKEIFDFALSVIQLNHFTKWYDAIMLSYHMPLELCTHNLLYSKLLSVDPAFQSTITELAKVSISTTDGKTEFSYGTQTVSCHPFSELFYNRTNYNKLSRDILADIFKNRNRETVSTETFPIVKWIFLLEHHDIDEEYLEILMYSGYREYLERPKGSVVLPPIQIPDPYADNFTLSDYYRHH